MLPSDSEEDAMNATSRIQQVIVIAAMLSAASCGERTSQSRETAGNREAPAAASEAVAETTVEATEAEAEASVAEAPAAPAATATVRAEAPAAATTPAPEAAEPREVDGLAVRRLVVAHDVENREPVGEGVGFRVSSDPVVAFVELRNGSSEARQVQVRFQSEDGRTLGPVTLDVPANAPRWRTWARSGWLRRAGAWTVTVTTLEGELLETARFDVES